jgi:rare lipoprotein A (peptidoglycan hydrolase)
MKRRVIISLLLAALVWPLAAQQREEGLAARHESEASGFYATHRTLPFGTQMLIVNMENNTRVTVQVGGRPPEDSMAMIEVSPEAANQLNLVKRLTHVQIETQVRESAQQRVPRSGAIKQTGTASPMAAASEELIAFHPSIALGTRVRLTNAANRRTVVVTIQGRIRASRDRIVEISTRAARELGIRGGGEVHLETLSN